MRKIKNLRIITDANSSNHNLYDFRRMVTPKTSKTAENAVFGQSTEIGQTRRKKYPKSIENLKSHLINNRHSVKSAETSQKYQKILELLLRQSFRKDDLSTNPAGSVDRSVTGMRNSTGLSLETAKEAVLRSLSSSLKKHQKSTTVKHRAAAEPQRGSTVQNKTSFYQKKRPGYVKSGFRNGVNLTQKKGPAVRIFTTSLHNTPKNGVLGFAVPPLRLVGENGGVVSKVNLRHKPGKFHHYELNLRERYPRRAYSALQSPSSINFGPIFAYFRLFLSTKKLSFSTFSQNFAPIFTLNKFNHIQSHTQASESALFCPKNPQNG